jgi:hypothetical protein
VGLLQECFSAFRSFAFRIRAFAAALDALIAMRRRSSAERLAALVLPPMRPSSAAASCWAGVKRRVGCFFIQQSAYHRG